MFPGDLGARLSSNHEQTIAELIPQLIQNRSGVAGLQKILEARLGDFSDPPQ